MTEQDVAKTGVRQEPVLNVHALRAYFVVTQTAGCILHDHFRCKGTEGMFPSKLDCMQR